MYAVRPPQAPRKRLRGKQPPPQPETEEESDPDEDMRALILSGSEDRWGTDTDASMSNDSDADEPADDDDLCEDCERESVFDIKTNPVDVEGRRAAKYGLSPLGLRILLFLGAPPLLFNMLYYMVAKMGAPRFQDHLFFIEYFSGVGSIHQACKACEVPSAAYDINHDALLQDITTSAGFANLINWTRKLRPGRGGTHWATVCSTWVWMSRSTTGRRNDNILGLNSSGGTTALVAQANRMVSRMILAFMLIHALGCSWTLEQPSSSLMFRHPRLLALLEKVASYSTHTWMGMYGAKTPKATKLLGSNKWVLDLFRSKPNTAVFDCTGVTRREANGGISGGPLLKETQQYPLAYGFAVFDAWKRSELEVVDIESLDGDAEGPVHSSDPWSDAGAGEVGDWLQIPTDRLL